MAPRVGVASVVQESNTFSPRASTLDDFREHGILRGPELARLAGTNTEAAGALVALAEAGATPLPLLRAWAMSGGTLTAAARGELERLLREELRAGGPLDGLVLSLHGALVSEDADSADATLLAAARDELGPTVPIAVCLDLHANVTPALVDGAELLVGYHTYPHVDMAETGARAARLLLDRLAGRTRPVTRRAWRPMLSPPEGQLEDGPLGDLRAAADARTTGAVLDVSLFPVQPWLDVPDLGLVVTVTTDGDPDLAAAVAESLAERAWELRERFGVELVAPEPAIALARRAPRRPLLVSHSADSPTAGATADGAAMLDALLRHGDGLRAAVTLVDAAGVAAAHAAGGGAAVRLRVGASLDDRFGGPVELEGVVRLVGDAPVTMGGPTFAGMAISMGRFAVVVRGELEVLLTERPAPTFDPEAFRHAGIDVEACDVVVVRSANLFRAAWSAIAPDVVFLDVPGASTPRLASLPYRRAPRPLYPLDEP